MPKKPTAAQMEMYLRLYELRREAKLRAARDWFLKNYFVEKPDDYQRLAPPGSEENAYVRMTISYWEMACGILNLGLLPEEFFFQHTGEFYAVWDRLKPTIAALRQGYRNPHMFAEMEKAARRFEKWMERRAPGHIAEVRKALKQMAPHARPAAAS